MSATTFIFALAALCMVSCEADIDVTVYVYWKKADIKQWHTFFPSRALMEERTTIGAAVEAVDSLISGVKDDLAKILAFQNRELQTAQQLMAGTDAEGCITGISNVLNQAVEDQQDLFLDCTADAQSKLSRLNSSWARVNTTYQAAYQRALAGIDACAKTYPNKDSIDRLRSCIESMNNNYFVAAQNAQSSVFPSPSMSYFQKTVVQCASSAAQAVAAKGLQFLKMLVSCAALSGTVDPSAYAEELSQWKGYNDTLADQIADAQIENYNQVWTVEREMVNYYNMQKQALEKNVIESRGQAFYLNQIFSYLSSYYNTMTATSLDNPGDSGCVVAAKTGLDAFASLAAGKSLICDELIVNDTKRLLVEIYDSFATLNGLMSSIGNVAVLQCFSQGSVFAPNTIRLCYTLTSASFNVTYTDRHDDSDKAVQTLASYSFISDADLPCGGTSLKRLYLGAEKVLYELQRCLYKSSGTTYDVTTPIPDPYTTPMES